MSSGIWMMTASCRFNAERRPSHKMTREEAIAVLEESKRQNEIMRDNPTTFWASYQIADGIKNTKRRIDALDAALTALRPVSRGQVETVWRGEWTGNFNAHCSLCDAFNTMAYIGQGGNFCPSCGAPMTDEAVDILFKRLEAMKDGKAD